MSNGPDQWPMSFRLLMLVYSFRCSTLAIVTQSEF